jgi:DNA ligase-1
MNSDHVFDAFNRIAKVNGTTLKRAMLSDYMKPYIVAALDPFQQYYAKRDEVEAASANPDGAPFTDETWCTLHKLKTREVSGTTAHQIINKTIRELTPESAALFIRILNKDLRIGLRAKTINKRFPGLIPTHDIMLAKLFDESKVTFPCWAGPKIDGVRAVFRKGHFYSRKGLQFRGLEFLESLLSDFIEPIDGELIVPGVSFQVGSGKIRSDSPTPDAAFYIFELPTVDAPFSERIQMMQDLSGMDDSIRVVPHVEILDLSMLYDYYEQCRKQGYEGTVVRTYDYKYVGTRSFHWMKMKPKMKDLELKVVDLFEGNGKYKGQLGGVIVEYHGSKGKRKVRVGGGFTDNQREFFYNCPSAIMFKYIQAEAMEETDEGSLRHPIFKEVKE